VCGITAFFCRESVPDYKYLDLLFRGAEQRGQDGFGYALIRCLDGERKIQRVTKWVEPYSEIAQSVKYDIDNIGGLQIGDVIMAIARAQPETEPETKSSAINETAQPIYNQDENLVLIHNGAVSQQIYNDLYDWSEETHLYNWHSVIDSEAILACYVKHGRNMKDTMENLSGGFACILYDEKKDMLYVINDHMQLSHCYIRGLGFFLHSDNDVLGQVIHDYLGATRDGMFIWENFYHHYLDGHAIREIDLQSGFMRKEKYTPRYITPAFDTIKGVIK